MLGKLLGCLKSVKTLINDYNVKISSRKETFSAFNQALQKVLWWFSDAFYTGAIGDLVKFDDVWNAEKCLNENSFNLQHENDHK